jgi:RNA polymerase sigma-70 factor, ECF subfamily
LNVYISMIIAENCEKKTDIEIIKLSLDDPDYYFCLLKRYEDKLLRYIIGFAGLRKEDAEDVLQEVFISTYRNLNEFDPRMKFSSWIYRITHNQAISHLRKAGIRPTVSFSPEEADRLADEFNVTKEIDGKIERERINQILERMDKKYREALMLRFLDGKEYLEIADILKKPTSTVGNLISRGRKIFKKEYKKSFKTYGK